MVQIEHFSANCAFRNDQNIVDQFTNDRVGQVASAAYSSTVDKRIDFRKGDDLALLERSMHGGCALWLDAVNLDSGETGTNPGRNSRKEATATNRDQHSGGLGKDLFLELDGDCSLAGNGIRIVVGVDVGAAGVARSFLCLCVRTVESTVDDHLFNPIAANRFDTLTLLLGSIGRKVDGSANLQLRTGKCQPLSMVACGCTHDSAAALFFAEHTHAEVSTSHLK